MRGVGTETKKNIDHKEVKEVKQYANIYTEVILLSSVAETKLFIFGSGSDFDHNFSSGSGSSYSYILALKTVLKHLYSTNRGRNYLFFILASSKLTAENVY